MIDNLYVDFDDTLVGSSEVIVGLLNKRFNTNKNVKDLTTWNYTNLFPTIKGIEIEELFDTQEFFDKLKWKDGAVEFINRFSDKIIILSKGNALNLTRKKLWIRKQFPDIKFIGLESDVSKASINMGKSDCIIDDHADNLLDVRAEYRIMFESFKYVEWNEKFYKHIYGKKMQDYNYNKYNCSYKINDLIMNSWKNIEEFVDNEIGTVNYIKDAKGNILTILYK